MKKSSFRAFHRDLHRALYRARDSETKRLKENLYDSQNQQRSSL
jgi:hypothetical protein